MHFSPRELIERVPKHDLRAAARLITQIENNEPSAREVLGALYRAAGRARIIGVTGSPGAGKSTLVDQLAADLNAAGKKAAIIAVDPTSPFTGGAVLGDRIRMARSESAEGIFIRSMATRGSLGGLARATNDAVCELDAAGFDVVLVETVGVGQAEVDVVRTAETIVVVLVPGMGDSVQAIKAGILEIADVFAVNKADRPGADLVQKDLRILLTLTEPEEGSWKPPIVATIATSGEGCAELADEISRHGAWLRDSKSAHDRKLRVMEETIISLAREELYDRVEAKSRKDVEKMARQCLARKLDPYSAAEKLISKQ
jgi:LAO/AO transport system kinase